MTSILAANIVNRATSFVVYALVARSLGVDDLGRLALGMSIFMLFAQFTDVGLSTVATRDVARDRQSAGNILASGSIIVASSVAVAFGVVTVLGSVVGYQEETISVIRILFVGLLPHSFAQLAQAVFIGREESRWVFVATAPVNIVQTIVATILLLSGTTVGTVAWTIVGAHTATAILFFVALARAKVVAVRPSVADGIRLLRTGLPFLGIQAMNAIASNGTIIVLSALGNETDVGLASAAFQLIVPVNLVSVAAATSVYPVMSRRYLTGERALADVTMRAIEAVQTIVSPAAVGLMVLATPLIELVFGAEFEAAGPVLAVVALTGFARGLTAVMGQMLWASNRERSAFAISVNRAWLVLVSSWLFVSSLGLIGAAWASVVVSVVNVAQHQWTLRNAVRYRYIFNAVSRSLFASIAMFLVVASNSSFNVFVRVSIGVVIYSIALAVTYRFGARRRSLRDLVFEPRS